MSVDLTKQSAYVSVMTKDMLLTKQSAYVGVMTKDMLLTQQSAYITFLPDTVRQRRRMPLIIN